MEGTIFLDLDGVLADLQTALEKKFDVDLTDFHKGGADFEETFGVDVKTFWEMLYPNFWVDIPKMPDADLILALVEPYNPTIFTAHPGYGIESCVVGKLWWIQDNLPEYYKNDRVLIGRDKSIIAPGNLLIDDSDYNVNQWRMAGGKAILVPRPWNSKFEESTLEYLQEQLMKHLGDDY